MEPIQESQIAHPSATGLTSRRNSIALSQLELPNVGPDSATIDQIHANNSATTGLTSFYLGSPPPTSAEPLSFNKLYSKVKSVAAGVREAVRDVVVVGGPASYRSEGNDSKESFENVSVGNTANNAPTTASNFPNRARQNSRYSLSNASVMSRGSIGSIESAAIPALKRVNNAGSSVKFTQGSSPAPVASSRDVIPEVGAGEDSTSRKRSAILPFRGAGRPSSIGTGYSSPSPAQEEFTFNNRFSPLEDCPEDSSDEMRLGGDGASENPAFGNRNNLGAHSNDDGILLHAEGIAPSVVGPFSQDMQLISNAQVPASNSNPPLTSSSQIPSIMVEHRTGPAKPRISVGMSGSKSMRRRPKPVKRTSESLLPGFAVNSESDTYDEDEENTSSPGDNTSNGGTTTGLQRDTADVKSQWPTSTAFPAVVGVRAIAGWLGVGGSTPESQTDKSTNGPGAGNNGGGGDIEAVGLALRQLRTGKLTREFWMKDENCKECFLCMKTFTTFRRKHHCRMLPNFVTSIFRSTCLTDSS